MKSFAKSLFAYLCVALIAMSCGGNDNPSPAISKNCKLSKITQVANGTNSITTLKYDNANRLIEMFTTTNLSNKVENTTYTFTYNTAGQLATRKLVSPNRVSNYVFIYKSNGQIEEVKTSTLFAGDTQNSQENLTFEYNAASKIAKIISNGITRIYGYDSKGNVSSVQTNFSNNVYITTYQYDDKKSYYSLIQSAFPEEPIYQNINNLVVFDYKRNGVPTSNTTYEYVYNSKGLPTKYTILPQNSSSSVFNLEYTDCE